MHLRKLSTSLLVLALAATTGAVTPAAAGAVPGPGTMAQRGTSVTLITGDEVTFTDDSVSVRPGPGREGIRFAGQERRGRRYVIPLDALPLVRAQRVDRRLFDLGALADFGYTGDAELPYLVAYSRTSDRKAISATARVARDLPAVGALAMRAARPGRADLWRAMVTGTPSAPSLRPGIERIYLDGKRPVGLDASVAQIGAPAAWQQGLDGSGVTVAVLDSGIDATHPDFAGRISALANFTNLPTADDNTGHGTHVASILAGSGAKSGGRYRGVAPGAKLAIGKVCEQEWCEDSAILAGMQWAAPLAPVINMSLGNYDAPGLDPLEQAVEDLTATHGTLFVIAAGNMGLDGDYTVGTPGTADAALTVGAVDREDQIAGFSSRGPRLGDEAIKPDITAPGVDIVAAAAANGTMGGPAADGYVIMNGTSMAAPHVAGAAAILTQQHPGWSPLQRKTALMGAAQPNPGASVFAQGAGRVDVARAVRQAVSVDEGSLGYGIRRWPHEDQAPAARTLTYRNGGGADVTLGLDLQADPDTYALSATSVTVPAGGTARVTLTVDTRGAGPYGDVSGRVVATAGDVRMVTPVAVHREAEAYDVTLRHTARDGTESANNWTTITSLGTGEVFEAYAGEAGLRLPAGEYALAGQLYGETDATLLVQPRLVVDAATTVDLDARRGRPVVITPPRRDAAQALLAIHANWTGGPIETGTTVTSATPGDTYTAQIGGAGRVPGFRGLINSAFARPDAGGRFVDSPFSYEASYQREGSFFTGFTRELDPSTLARVAAHYPREASGDLTLVKTNRPVFAGPGSWTVSLPAHAPFRRTEWLNTDGGVRWAAEFEQRQGFDPISASSAPPVRLKAGRTYRQDWNRATFAPSVAGNPEAAVRRDDVIVAGVPLFGEGSGHPGWSNFERGRAALYANGRLIGEEAAGYAEFPVEPGELPYRLEMSATRGAPHRLSTSVSASWTFRSGNGDGTLPLSTVRFSPRLDEQNTAPAGAFSVPVTVERAPGSAAATNRLLTAEFSTDDGTSWQPARVTGSGGERVIRVTNPAGPGAVSLRVRATDRAGNTATVTIVRAYLVR